VNDCAACKPKYTITYNANGGQNPPSAQTKTHDANITLSSIKPTKAGYDFLGWAASGTAAAAAYQPGGSYTANADITLYAVWAKQTPAHNHIYANWIEIKAATCTDTGTEIRACTICGENETREINAAHTWNAWSVLTPATPESDGREVRTCTLCYANEYRTASMGDNDKIVFNSITSFSCNNNIIIFNYNFGPNPIDADELLHQIANDGVKAFDRNGKELAKNDPMGTGAAVILFDGDDKELDRYTVVVTGDIDGDGKVTALDARAVLRASAKLDALTGVYFDAANVLGTGLSALAARKVLRVAARLDYF